MKLMDRARAALAAISRQRLARLAGLARDVRYYLTPGNADRSIAALRDLLTLQYPTEWQRQHQRAVVGALQEVVDQAGVEPAGGIDARA